MAPFPHWMRPIKMLMVVDGDGDFNCTFGEPDPTDYYFSLSHLVSRFESPLYVWGPPFQLTKAHRSVDPGGAPGVLEHFRFNEHDLSVYDQIWLMGFAAPGMVGGGYAPPLTAAELEAVTTFMEAGGGVFATGDHAGLGGRMCQHVPRVRSMRKWYYKGDLTSDSPPGPNGEPGAPPPLGPHRLDTTVHGHNGTDPGPQAVWFDNQSDDIPQYLSPYTDRGVVGGGPWNNPGYHPLLQGTRGPILAFPDHMHEGEVVVPSNLDTPLRVDAATGAPIPSTDKEYPRHFARRPAPVIAAFGFSGGQRTEVQDFEAAVHTGSNTRADYRAFGVVGAYDGSWVGVGRVVVDSTFHHFVDINLIGDPMAHDPVKKAGFKASPSGREILSGLDDYFRNIAYWLVPRPFSWLNLLAIIDAALRMHPLSEILASQVEPEFPTKLAEEVGTPVLQAISRFVPVGMVADMVASGLPDNARELVMPLLESPSDADPLLQTMLGHVALGLHAARHSDREKSSSVDSPTDVAGAALHRALRTWSDHEESRSGTDAELRRAILASFDEAT